MVNAILYQARTGCQWRYLPGRFGPWGAIWQQSTRAATGRPQGGPDQGRPGLGVVRAGRVAPKVPPYLPMPLARQRRNSTFHSGRMGLWWR
jgi:hypothetical protein